MFFLGDCSYCVWLLAEPSSRLLSESPANPTHFETVEASYTSWAMTRSRQGEVCLASICFTAWSP